MALLGTHIRFALDVKDNFKVKNLDKYISGTVYPDSRYITKINREITHSNDFLNDLFYQDNDFKKGWFVHLICDKIQSKVFEYIFPELSGSSKDTENKLSPEYWVLKTNLKIFQDLHDVSQFPIKNYLNHLKYIETPNNEEIKLVKKYNQILIDLYQKNKLITQDLVNMWANLGIGKEMTNQIKKKNDEMNSDVKILEKIPLIYPEMLSCYKNSK
ncbi:MAG: hypothetical protein KIH89_003675 [Candidatus Shapirobacteria bacterium]|nr:hypothetical protein [Candidatus Shapirobacteria bacterium]